MKRKDGRKKTTAAQKRARGTNALKTGEHSQKFQKWLKKHDLEIPELPEEFWEQFDSLSEQMKKRWLYFDFKKQQMQKLADWYRQFGHQGMELVDELQNLDMMITEREMKLRQEGKDPLEDDHLRKARDQKIKIMKQLEKQKFDKSKFMAEQKVQNMREGNEGAFEVEIPWEEIDED